MALGINSKVESSVDNIDHIDRSWIAKIFFKKATQRYSSWGALRVSLMRRVAKLSN